MNIKLIKENKLIQKYTLDNLLENRNATPLSIVESKVTLLEHITGKQLKPKLNPVLENFNKQDSDTRLLTYKVLLEKFNDKYSGL